MKKFWISAAGGIVIGTIISMYVFQDEPFIYSYDTKYPEATYTFTSVNFELIVDASRIIIISFAIIFAGWILIDKLINKFGKQDD